MREKTTVVDTVSLSRHIRDYKDQGYRFVATTCVDLDGENVDVIYHLDKDLELVNLRLTVSKAEPLPSVSNIYGAAMLAENEMRDLFGLSFNGLSLDFGRKLYLDEDAALAPFAKKPAAKPDASKE